MFLETRSSSSNYENRNCPACDADNPLLGRDIHSSPPAESCTLQEIEPYWHALLKEKMFFSYSRCGHCGILYCRQYLTKTQLDQLYSQMRMNMVDVDVDVLGKTQEKYFRTFKRFSNLRGQYLEVGPDVGLFTKWCVDEGNFSDFWLFEPNQAIQANLKQVLKKKPAHIFPSFLNLDALPQHQISTAVMIHVLDHLPDPKEMLLKLRTKLTSDAVLMFVTHDESSLMPKIIGKKWPPYCLQHPLLFRPSSMTHLLNSAGYDVLTIEKTVNYFPIQYLAKNFFWILGLKKLSLPDFFSFTISLQLGNIITLAQPKSVHT